ncbi:two-component response regulator [Halalkalibacter wakoensis JCM 9140]|uniref:Two-component response regulator n=1 Tax=Halalkalibacter wakoensis JCM 9140 TaxID=1236970 RepID=W4Q605_9BACI|nr:response regulator [Halalkalibacter wakoensis]GAE26809.1 two-component response regulator [Halalkalibacter wakoensis JCM 9140]
MINVLIIEDDPMVAEFNKRYLNEIEGFHLTGIAKSFDEAIELLGKEEVDLLLLDIFMAGKNGLELIQYIRNVNKWKVDVILITAADDVDSIQIALRCGAVDYMIKPFEFERFNQSLTTYREKHRLLKKQHSLNQEELDRKIFAQNENQFVSLPKGLTANTLQLITEAILEKGEHPFSTDELAAEVQISRVSVRKYIKFLKEIGVLAERMTYGAVGRPVYLYINKELTKSTFQHFY